jgi:hypothetical protein
MIDNKTKELMFADRGYLTLQEIAVKYNIKSYQTVQAALNRHGLRLPRKTNRAHKYNLTEAELAYIAGIIDGEGYIKLSSLTGKIGISNTHLGMLEWLKERLGGSICKKSKEVKPNHHQAYELQLSKVRARGLLKLIIPYLIVKKDTAIKFIDCRF